MHCQHDICEDNSFTDKKKHKRKKPKAENVSSRLEDVEAKPKKKQKDHEVSASFECAVETDVQEGYCSEISDIQRKVKHKKKHKKDGNEDINENLGLAKVKHKKKCKKHKEDCEIVSAHYKQDHRHEILVNKDTDERSDHVDVKRKKKRKKDAKECETHMEQMEECREDSEENRQINGVSVGLKKKHKHHKSEHKEKNDNWIKVKNKENVSEYETSSMKKKNNSKETVHEIGEPTRGTPNLKKKHKKRDKHHLAEYEENVQKNTTVKHKKKHKQRLDDVSEEEQECAGFEKTKRKKKHKMKDWCDVEQFENKKMKWKNKHREDNDTLANGNVKCKKHSQDTEMLVNENKRHKKKHKRLTEVFEEEHVGKKKKHKLNMEIAENQCKKHKKKHKQNVEGIEGGTEEQTRGLEEFSVTKQTQEHRQNIEDISMVHEEECKSCVSIKVKYKNEHYLERSGKLKVKDKKRQRREHKEGEMAKAMSKRQKEGKENIEKEAAKVKQNRQHALNNDKIEEFSFRDTEHHHRNETNLTKSTNSAESTEPHGKPAKNRKKHRCKANDDGDGGSVYLVEKDNNAEVGQQEKRREMDHKEEADLIIIDSESEEGNCNSSELLWNMHTSATVDSSATVGQKETLKQKVDIPGSESQDEIVDIEGDSDSGNPLTDSACRPDKCQHLVYVIQKPDDDKTLTTGKSEESAQSGYGQYGLNEGMLADYRHDIDKHLSWSLSEEERLQDNWNRYLQNHPSDEPDKLLHVPEDASLEEKRRIRIIRTETKFEECLADGIYKPLPVIMDKARSMLVKNVSTSRKSTTLSGWSDTEIKQLENNWKQFFKDYPMDNPYELLSPVHLLSRERHSFLMKFKKQTSFMERLRQGINRSALSIYHKAKRHFYPYTEVTGKFSEEEMLELKKLIALHGKKLLLISTLMERNPTHIEFQFKRLEREEKNCVTGRWSQEEEKRLIEAVSEQVGFDVTDNEHCFDKKRFSNLRWCEIAEKVQTRDFFQCFQKWMYTYCTSKHSRRSDVTLEKQLLKLIDEQNVEEERDIDWMAIYEQIQTVPSPNSLKRLFRHMCHQVENREKKSHKELLATLFRVYNLCCENPVVVSYT